MIDLSFLTEEEQEAIMKVLQRDAELKRAEEERVRHLPEKIKDDQQLKNMSGQWFYEAKAKRHRDTIHGADVIRASIRKKKPQTIVQQSQNRTARVQKTWVNNVNRDILLPSELLGVVEEPEDDVGGQSNSRIVVLNPPPSVSEENPWKSYKSPPKLRRNPFNGSILPEDNLSFQIPNEPSDNGQSDLLQTSKEGTVFHSKINKSDSNFPNQRSKEPRLVDGLPKKVPIPKARTLIYTNRSDPQSDDNQAFPKLAQRTDSLNNKSTPRGILKRNSSSSSNDSEIVRFNPYLEPKSKNLPSRLSIHEGRSEKDHSIEDESSQNLLEPLKHVRFSTVREEVSQGSELNHGKEVGEFALLESDTFRDGMEDAGDLKELPNKPVFSRYRKPAQQKSPASYFDQINGTSPSTDNIFNQTAHPYSMILPQRLSSNENLPSHEEFQEESSKPLSLESELYKNPADESPHWVEPETTQVQDLSHCSGHQQGKHIDFKALHVNASSHYDQNATGIMKATNKSISKVLDWFSRSSDPDEKSPSFLHPQKMKYNGKSYSKWHNNSTVDIGNGSLQQDGLKSPFFMKGDLKTVETNYPFRVKGDPLSFENGKDSNIEGKKSASVVLPKQVGKEKGKPSQVFKSQNQGSRNTILVQDTKNPNKGKETHFLNTGHPFNTYKELEAEYQVSSKVKDSSYKEKPRVLANIQSRRNSSIASGLSEDIGDSKLKHNMEAKSRRVKKADSLSSPSEGKNIRSQTFVGNEGFRDKESNFPTCDELSAPCKKPEGLQQQETGHLTVSQVQGEEYKKVSDRISFWEGGRKTNKETDKVHSSSESQIQEPAKVSRPMESEDLSVRTLNEDQNEYGQIVAGRVDVNKNSLSSHVHRFYSSVNPEEFRHQRMGTSRVYSSVDQPGRIYQSESVKLPVTDNLQSKKSMSFPTSQDSHGRNEVYSHLENDRSVGQWNPSSKVCSLEEKMNENFPEQINNLSQFQNLKKFWDKGTNLDSFNGGAQQNKHSLSFECEKDKELDKVELPGEESTSAGKDLLRQNKESSGDEIGKWNSKMISQTHSDETTFPVKSPTKSIQLPRNVPLKENVDEYLDWFVPPKLKDKGHFSREEVKESVIKTYVSPKEYLDTFNRSLKKLLEEAPSLSFQHSGVKIGPGNEHKLNFPENETCLQETALFDFEARSQSPQKDPNINTANILHSTEAKYKPLNPIVEKSFKESPELPHSSNQVNSEIIFTGTSSLSNQRRFFEKVMERSYNISLDKKEGELPLGGIGDDSDNTVMFPKVKNSRYQTHQERLIQEVPAPSHSLYQTSDHKKESFGEAAIAFQESSSIQSGNATLQDRQSLPQREISETIEKTVLPKIQLNNLNTVLEKLHKEAQEDASNSTKKRRNIPREGPLELPEGDTVTYNLVRSPVWIAEEPVAPAEKTSQPIDMGLEEPGNVLGIFSGSCLDSPYFEQPHSQPHSTSYQHSKELPQEISESMTKVNIRSRANLGKKLLREGSKSPSLKDANDTIKNPPAKLIDRSALSQHTDASQIQHPYFLEEIRETIEKSSAPSRVESAFDIGLKKILKEASEFLPTVRAEKETSSIRVSPSEQEKLSPKMPHLYSGNSYDAEAKVKSEVLPEDEEFIDDKAVVTGEGEPQVSESGIQKTEIMSFHMSPETSKNELKHNITDRETSDCAYGDARKKVPHVTNEDPSKKDSQTTCIDPSVLLPRKKTPSKISKAELFLNTPHEGEEKEILSGSDFSDDCIDSTTTSRRNSFRSEEETNPVLKRNADRKMPSPNLEDFPSDTSNQGKVNLLPEDLVRSAEDDQKTDQQQTTDEFMPGISTEPSFPDNQFAHPEKLKRMSKSVPEFLQDESDDRETDTASESSYQLGRHKKSPSSLTNLSSSSGMTSLSSVSGSAMSVYSGDFGNLDIKGSVQFAIDYVDSLKEFHVFVAQCKDLAAADVKKQRSDPYVKTYLLPDKGKMGKKKTAVMKKTLNPVYNDILRYKIDKQNLKNQKLNLSVWHRDTFKRNSFLGEVELDLETWDWDNKENKQLKWYPLNRRTAPTALETDNRGEVKLALQYVPQPSPDKKFPTTGEVHIWVKECINLPPHRGNHLNSFVKCTILPDTSRKSRQKTRVVGKTTNPFFNHTMVYDGFRPEDLNEACAELTVWDHHKLTNQFLGGLRMGFGKGKSYGTEVDWMDSTPAEVALWERMVNSPNTWVEGILPLRMLLIAKLTM